MCVFAFVLCVCVLLCCFACFVLFMCVCVCPSIEGRKKQQKTYSTGRTPHENDDDDDVDDTEQVMMVTMMMMRRMRRRRRRRMKMTTTTAMLMVRKPSMRLLGVVLCSYVSMCRRCALACACVYAVLLCVGV